MLTQKKSYTNDELIEEVRHLIKGDLIADLANISSLLYTVLPDLNWLGFYILKGSDLVVGPFQGKPACVRIPVGRGVCGSAAESLKTIVVDNVEEFSGHISCDANSKSEIVVPILKDGKLVAVIDVDSPLLKRFTIEDKSLLEKISQQILTHLPWEQAFLAKF